MVEVVDNPDRDLLGCGQVVASADRMVLDGCARWYNLARDVIDAQLADAFLVDLSQHSP